MVVPIKPVYQYPMSAASTQVVSEVLSKLLTVGITDPGMTLKAINGFMSEKK